MALDCEDVSRRPAWPVPVEYNPAELRKSWQPSIDGECSLVNFMEIDFLLTWMPALVLAPAPIMHTTR